MSFLELLLIGVGLSMDAFAVAICQGLSMTRLNWRHAGVIALFFGGFQAAMPMLGWALGSRFAVYIQELDHWVAFVLLGLIGGNMVREALGPEEEVETACAAGRLDVRQLFLMAVATSIDALAVGVTFAFLQVELIPAVTLIGVCTFLLSAAGVCSRRRAEEYILAGRVTVNGKTAGLGDKADPVLDCVAVDGAANAAILAAQMLALADPDLAQRLAKMRAEMTAAVLESDKRVAEQFAQ